MRQTCVLNWLVSSRLTVSAWLSSSSIPACLELWLNSFWPLVWPIVQYLLFPKLRPLYICWGIEFLRNCEFTQYRNYIIQSVKPFLCQTELYDQKYQTHQNYQQLSDKKKPETTKNLQGLPLHIWNYLDLARSTNTYLDLKGPTLT